jgi:ssDNA-binding Zn-finger/Zn-ribbon topoisomerase 1
MNGRTIEAGGTGLSLHGYLWGALGVLIAFLLAGPAAAQTDWDYTKFVGPDKCAECHKGSVAIWTNTHHFKTVRELPNSEAARQIAMKMGLKRIKSGLCLDCHFTTVVESEKRKPVAGVSCESCHGPAADYLKRHSEFSGKNKATETDAEREQRWADSEAAGMIRPQDLYRGAENCYSCHVVPLERLVNEGGHAAGSAFELVSWSMGEIRHNVWYTEDKDNPVASPERRRLIYVVGLAVELESALRAVGEATAKADYAVSMAKRAKRAQFRFKTVADALSEPEVAEIMVAATSAKLKLNNKTNLIAAADRIADATKRLAATYDGSSFRAIDHLIPGADKYKGSPSQ